MISNGVSSDRREARRSRETNFSHDTDSNSLLSKESFPQLSASLTHELSQSQFSFKRAATLFVIAWSFVSALIVTRRNIIERDLRPIAATRVLRENASIPWSDNVNVFASTTQDEVAFFYKDYTHQLANLLYRSDIHGLGTAQQYLEQNGLAGMYRIEPQLPVSTPGRYRAWDKRLECNRHVLLITGSGDGGPFVNVAGFGDERHFVSQARYLQQSLQDNFGLQDSQFTTLREPSRDDLHAALKDIQDRLHSDGELIIYFAAHGERIPYGTSQHAQGSHDGILSITEAHCLDEMEIKELVRHYCGHLSNVTIIVDACYGGAFIS